MKMNERIELVNLDEALNELEREQEEFLKEEHEPVFENIEDLLKSGIFGRCVYEKR